MKQRLDWLRQVRDLTIAYILLLLLYKLNLSWMTNKN